MLSWKPVRSGPQYCSPACGGRCTWAAFQKAKRAAAALQKALGPGWEPRVWENLGWYYCVNATGKSLSVYPVSDRRYHANWYGWWIGDGSTPQSAIAAAVEEAKPALAQFRVMADYAEELERIYLQKKKRKQA